MNNNMEDRRKLELEVKTILREIAQRAAKDAAQWALSQPKP